jgi:hypothetical protein
MTGHECWMAGQAKLYIPLMMQNSFVAPNINFENPDEDSTKLNMPKVQLKKIWFILSNSFSLGNNSPIIRKLNNKLLMTDKEIIEKYAISGREFEVEAKINSEANLKNTWVDSLDYIDCGSHEKNFAFK